MSKIPYTGKSQQARQGQVQQTVSADPLAVAENLPAENPLMEDPDALAARLAESEDFVRNNRNLLLGILAAVVAAMAGGFGYYAWHGQQEQKAQTAMFRAANYWEVDSLKKANKGDGKAPGLTTVANEYSGTKAGNLANFYAGVASLKEGKYKEALDYLEDFSSDDYLVQSRAYSLDGRRPAGAEPAQGSGRPVRQSRRPQCQRAVLARLPAEGSHGPRVGQGQRRCR